MVLVIILPLFVVLVWLVYFLMPSDRKGLKAPAGRLRNLRESGKDENARFTKDQAVAKLGKPVRVMVELPDIPKGALGHVTEIDEIEPGQFDLIIEWDVQLRGRIQHDWFNREQYEQRLTELLG